MAVTPVAFYAVSNEEHFLGLVALLNSLRLRGHKEPLLVADCGLAAWQLEALAPHAEVVAVDRETSPYMLKTSLPRGRPAWKMVLLDADLLVLRPLTPILEEQAAVVAFADPVAHRFHPEWAELLDVPPIRRLPYVNSGLLVLSGDIGRSILDLVAGKQKRVDTATTRAEGGRPSSPFYYSDQDVWNAVLASSVDPGELVVLPAELAPHPPFTASVGQEPYVLHHVDRKPWLHSTRANAYSRLLPRLLLGDDVALRLEPAQVPPRFRAGTVARLDRLRAEASALAYGLRGRVGLRRRLAERRRLRA
jgi:hypothetical protein